MRGVSLLHIQGLSVEFPARDGGPPVQAVDGLDLELVAGETYALGR